MADNNIERALQDVPTFVRPGERYRFKDTQATEITIIDFHNHIRPGNPNVERIAPKNPNGKK